MIEEVFYEEKNNCRLSCDMHSGKHAAVADRCGAPGAKEIENGTVKELSDGGAAIVSGDYRMDLYKSGEGYGLRVVDLKVTDGEKNISAAAIGRGPKRHPSISG